MKPASGDSSTPQSLLERLSALSHDLSNPLAVIMGNTQLLLELAKTMGVESDLRDPLKDIEEAAGRMEEQIALLNRLIKEQSAIEEDDNSDLRKL